MKDQIQMLVCGFISLTIGFLLYGDDIVSFTWETIDAKVISVKSHSYPISTKDKGTVEKNYNYVTLKFYIHGQHKTVENVMIDNLNPEVNDIVPLSISPKDPALFHYRQINWYALFMLILIGLLLSIVSITNIIKILFLN